MEQRRPPEYILEVFADPTCVKDIIKGILHTIFFHRYFPSIRPSSIEVLDLTLPTITDVELETLIDTRTTALIRQLSSTTSPNSSLRGQIAVQFFEKKRRRGGLGWFGGGKAEEEVCWEVWMLEITLATPRTEAGNYMILSFSSLRPRNISRHVEGRVWLTTRGSVAAERAKVRKAMETTLQKTAMKIVTIVNRDRDHIPPITTSETNPFPYQIVINPRLEGWGRMGIF